MVSVTNTRVAINVVPDIAANVGSAYSQSASAVSGMHRVNLHIRGRVAPALFCVRNLDRVQDSRVTYHTVYPAPNVECDEKVGESG